MSAKSPLSRLVINALLLFGSVLFLFPLVWMISTSLKPLSEATELPPRLIPYPEMRTASDGKKYLAVYFHPSPQEIRTLDLDIDSSNQTGEVLAARMGTENGRVHLEVDARGATKKQAWVPASEVRVPSVIRWENYVKAVTYNAKMLGYIPFARYARNTLYIAVLSVLGTVLSNALVAYGFARITWPGRDIAFGVTIATMMVPFPVLMVPVYVLFKTLGWVGSPKPLWVPAFFGSAFNIFLLRQFFMSLPFDLSDAAKIDGASEFRIFREVILPLAKPALAVVALFNFMYVWNDFLGPLIYLTDQRSYTLAYGLQAYQSQQGGTEWHLLMAAATIVVLPVIVVFFLAQKTFIQGITVTGMKG